MKLIKLFLIALFLTILEACNPSENKKQDQQNTDTVKTSHAADSFAESSGKDTVSVWIYDDINGTAIKNRELNAGNLTPPQLIDLINTTQVAEHVHLDFVRTSDDTIYVSIPESNHLTQEMGTSGADAFMLTTTYTLTELKNIRFVTYDFKLGDHAAPGTYSRKYYTDRKKSEEAHQIKKQ